MRGLLLGWLLLGSVVVQAEGTGLTMMANPVRKVVAMMQKMSQQIEEEAKEKEKMFDKFMCYCQDGGKNLAASISAAEEKIPQLESTIKESKGSKTQLEGDLKTAQADRAEAESTLAKAKSIREKENSDYNAEAAESKANIAALAKSIPAIERGSGASFIQENSGITEQLRQLSVSMDMEAVDRDLLASFLADGSTSRGSGEILGILKQMKDEMEKDLSELTASEQSQASDYESLVSAKKKQKTALTKAIETKTVRVGELAVKLAETANDLEDTKDALAEDKKMAGNLDADCKNKAKEYEEFKKITAEELVALADTIKMLNDDDALGLFKKTLPSSASSFMQVQVTAKSMQRRALQMLKAARKKHRHGDPRLDFLEMALHGGKVGFDKIIKMVDDLMGVLRKEQESDNGKKAYCLSEFDKYEDIAKGLAQDSSDLEKAINDNEETVKTLTKEVADLTQGIRDLDKSVGEATQTRKKENADYVKTLAQNGAAKELLEMAKNRLNQFYNPALAKAPAKRQLSEEDAIVVNMGGTLAPTAAPGGIAGTGIDASFVQVESQRHRHHNTQHYAKKGEEANGVIALINMLIGDLSKDNQVLELEEKESQKEYENFMGDAKRKRSLDAKAITDKEGTKAAAEASLEENKLALKGKKKESVETKDFLMGLHQECDWLLKFFDTRKEARADEIESLDKAKSVLSGADYSFLQVATTHLRGSK